MSDDHLLPLRDDPPGWRTRAACRGHDTNIFFDPTRTHEALALCDGCPVQRPCRTEGAAEEGIWGGVIPGPGPVWANRPGVRVGTPVVLRCIECGDRFLRVTETGVRPKLCSETCRLERGRRQSRESAARRRAS